MELRQLRYFIGIHEAGSLLHASRTLHIAQPALSTQIAALEDEVGVRLFTRSHRGVALTDAGRVFLAHAKVVLADIDRAKMAVRDSATVPRGDVVLGLPTSVAWVATVPLLLACRARYPHVKLKITEGYSGHLQEWLQMGRLDFAWFFGDKPEPGLSKRPLLQDRLVLLTSGQGVAPPRHIGLHELPHYPLILPGPEHGLRRSIEDACTPHGIALQVVAEIESLNSVKKAVVEGLGATLLPLGPVAAEVARGELHTSTVGEPGIVRQVVCATHSARPLTLASEAVMALLEEVARRMVHQGEWPATWQAPL